jgi:hypothetical protein
MAHGVAESKEFVTISFFAPDPNRTFWTGSAC